MLQLKKCQGSNQDYCESNPCKVVPYFSLASLKAFVMVKKHFFAKSLKKKAVCKIKMENESVQEQFDVCRPEGRGLDGNSFQLKFMFSLSFM